ncbi:MAG: RdgB/HAM1 family non-canonical purine NTP pyrophosphatase [Saprospiraceae bacterium]|nr:RdgB/HAM1 family non-canonical purine NTP pyrophosphatase [Saprospiraceae bacterium]
MKLCIATHNLHKKAEIQAVLPLNYQLLDLNDLGFFDPIEETGNSLDENAILKAKLLFSQLQKPCIADDSGLEVESLNMAPGVYSARYAGEEKDDLANMNLLLSNLKHIENRSARFRTVIAYIPSFEVQFLFEGIIEGRIAHHMKGSNGFGYDPIFIPNGYDETFGELSSEIKQKISHRSLAIQKFVAFLSQK